jgi:hypothetical protein
MRAAFVVLLVLAACDSTTPAVARWPHTTVDQGGMTFGVHWNRELEQAEAYRISHHWRPRLSTVMANAKVAIERVSGCKVAEGGLSGDQAIVKARLACSRG